MKLRAVILAQGDELTTGQTLDTNSHWLAGRLWDLGIPVRRMLTAPDDLDDLTEILQQAAALAPVVVSTGGLGPTRDDWTAEAAARAFGRELVESPEALAQVEARYATWGRVMPPVSRKQAVIPSGARVIENLWGTAPAFQVEAGGSALYFLPGVPREARPIYEATVEPEIRARFQPPAPRLRILRTVGVPESELEQRLVGVAPPGMGVGFRAMPGEVQVKLRFDPSVPEAALEAAVREVRHAIGPAVFGVDTGDLAEVTGHMLAERGQTVATAESCTAGRLAAWIASVPGASRYLMEGSVVYSNEAKTRTCAVPETMLAAHGAVSEPVARALAAGIRARAGTTWGMGITGVAGPGGGSPEKPVGTVHVAVDGPTGSHHRHLKLAGDRERIQALSAALTLGLLYQQLKSTG